MNRAALMAASWLFIGAVDREWYDHGISTGDWTKNVDIQIFETQNECLSNQTQKDDKCLNME